MRRGHFPDRSSQWSSCRGGGTEQKRDTRGHDALRAGARMVPSALPDEINLVF